MPDRQAFDVMGLGRVIAWVPPEHRSRCVALVRRGVGSGHQGKVEEMGTGERDVGPSRLERIADVAWWVLETILFVPADILTVGLRSAVIPQVVKRAFPSLACRKYGLFSDRVTCGPAVKYAHKGFFKMVVCGHCDSASGECGHRKARRPR